VWWLDNQYSIDLWSGTLPPGHCTGYSGKLHYCGPCTIRRHRGLKAIFCKGACIIRAFGLYVALECSGSGLGQEEDCVDWFQRAAGLQCPRSKRGRDNESTSRVFILNRRDATSEKLRSLHVLRKSPGLRFCSWNQFCCNRSTPRTLSISKAYTIPSRRTVWQRRLLLFGPGISG
jgi:hypothetical protein